MLCTKGKGGSLYVAVGVHGSDSRCVFLYFAFKKLRGGYRAQIAPPDLLKRDTGRLIIQLSGAYFTNSDPHTGSSDSAGSNCPGVKRPSGHASLARG